MRNKLITTFFLMTMLTTAHAAQISWSIGGKIDDSANIDTSVGSFVLAYIGTTSGVGIDAATFTTEIAKGTDSSYKIVDTGSWSNFYSSKKKSYSNAKQWSSEEDFSGDTYQAFYTVGGNYYLVNAPTISTLAVSIDGAGAASTTMFVNGESTQATSLYAAGGSASTIVSVPEPSTAALALAGLALLLKRRKA